MADPMRFTGRMRDRLRRRTDPGAAAPTAARWPGDEGGPARNGDSPADPTVPLPAGATADWPAGSADHPGQERFAAVARLRRPDGFTLVAGFVALAIAVTALATGAGSAPDAADWGWPVVLVVLGTLVLGAGAVRSRRR